MPEDGQMSEGSPSPLSVGLRFWQRTIGSMTLVRNLRQSVPWRAAFCAESPLFAPLAEPMRAFAAFETFPSPEAIHAALSERAGVSFERAPPVGRGRSRPRREEDLYDANIHARRVVRTRDGSWHDFLNALVWAMYPRSKWALHTRQHRLVASGLDPDTGKLPGARTPEQDALALFDEGGLVVASEATLETGDAIEDALMNQRASAVVFGHAIYEGVVLGAPWPAVRAVVVTAQKREDVDRELAARLDDSTSFSHPSSLPRVYLTAMHGHADGATLVATTSSER